MVLFLFCFLKGKPVVEKVANHEALVDDHVTFKCNVIANPAANIWWLYEGKFIEGTGFQKEYHYGQCNESLTMYFITHNHAGSYSCQARNVFGKALSIAGILIVKIKGRVNKKYQWLQDHHDYCDDIIPCTMYHIPYDTFIQTLHKMIQVLPNTQKSMWYQQPILENWNKQIAHFAVSTNLLNENCGKKSRLFISKW